MSRADWTVAMIATLILVGGCQKQERACIPGESRACACPGGAKGAQSCAADGSKLSSCDCMVAAQLPVAPPAQTAQAPATKRVTEPATPPEFSYTSRLGELDHVNTHGTTLATVGAVIRQDRARVHKFGQLDVGDSRDERYGDSKARVILEQLINAATLSIDVKQQILNNKPRIKVTVTEDSAKVEIIEPGPLRAGCIIERGRLGGLGLSEIDNMLDTEIPTNDPRRAGKLVVNEFSRIEDVTGNTVATSDEGATITITSPDCRTGSGVGIGSSLNTLRNDKSFGKLGCVCETEPGTTNGLSVSGPTEDTGESKSSRYHLSVQCTKPMACQTGGEAPACLGDWYRPDCKITSIAILPNAT